MGRLGRGQSRGLRGIIGLTAVLVVVALIGAQGEAAAATPPLIPLVTPALQPQPGGASARVERARAPEPARARKPRKAIVMGHTNYSGGTDYASASSPVLAVLHYFDGVAWQPYLQTYADQSGFYRLRVPPGPLPYAFYVSAKVSTMIYDPTVGLIPCKQTWADWSDPVRTRRGGVYSYMHTYLRPAQPGCDDPSA